MDVLSVTLTPVCGDTAYVLISRDLVQKFWQHGSISDVAAGDFDGPYFQGFFIDAYVNLTPDAAFGAPVLSGVPFAFTFGLDPCAINKEVQWPCGTAIRQAHVQCLLTST